MVPGTLVYKGTSIEPFSVECIEYDGVLLEEKKYESMNAFLKEHSLKEKNDVRWINVVGINHVEEIRKLSEAFDISNLIMEQVLHVSNHSINQYSEAFIFNDIKKVYTDHNHNIVNENISIFKRGHTVITFQEKGDDVFEQIRHRIRLKEGKIRQQSTAYLYYCLMDAIIDYYLGALEAIGRQIEILEEKVINVDSINVKNIHAIKKQLMVLKFSATPIEKMIQTFIADKNILCLENDQYLISLQGHIHEVVSELSLQKDYVDAIFENFVLNNSNEMNSVMTTLTIFSAIFIPLSFAAGVFGMNFNSVPGLDHPFAFVYFLVGCGLTAITMLVIFKRNKWF